MRYNTNLKLKKENMLSKLRQLSMNCSRKNAV